MWATSICKTCMLNEVAYVSLLEGSRSPTTIYSVVNPLEKLGRKRPSLLQTGTHKLLTSIHVALADIKKKRERERVYVALDIYYKYLEDMDMVK